MGEAWFRIFVLISETQIGITPKFSLQWSWAVLLKMVQNNYFWGFIPEKMLLAILTCPNRSETSKNGFYVVNEDRKLCFLEFRRIFWVWQVSKARWVVVVIVTNMVIFHQKCDFKSFLHVPIVLQPKIMDSTWKIGVWNFIFRIFSV